MVSVMLTPELHNTSALHGFLWTSVCLPAYMFTQVFVFLSL